MNDLLNLYQFPTGRRLFCLGHAQRILDAYGVEGLQLEVERAVALEKETRRLELQWRGQARNEHAPGTGELSVEVCHALGALEALFTATQKAFGGSSPEGRAAAAAQAALFPKGLFQLTSMPYVEQQVAVQTLLEQIQTEPKLGEDLRRVAAERFVAQLAEANERFRSALEVYGSGPSYHQMQEARRVGQETLAQVVVLLASELVRAWRKGEETEPFTQALQAVYEQNAAIRRLRRRRRTVSDVDPETGDELADDGGGEDVEDVGEVEDDGDVGLDVEEGAGGAAEAA